MWTSESRARYDRGKLRYPSDLTDAEWQLVKPLIPPGKPGGRKRTVIMREVVNGLMYVQVPAQKEIHAIVDNYATHKHPKVRQWLARHPRWAFHFTPISASWLNAVEGFFATLTKRRLKRGVFVSVVDLQAAINRFVVEHNAEPKPFRWTADPDKIIQAVRRGHQVLDSIH